MLISNVRDHRNAITGIMARYHIQDLRYVPESDGDAEVVFLVDPQDRLSYFDIFQMEDDLGAELHVRVEILTLGGLQGSYRDRILNTAQPI